MKYAALALIVALAVWFLTRGAGERVSSEQARALVSEGAYLLDVRTPGEFGGGHIEGAVNIPVAELSARLAELPPKETPIVVYCRSGQRSGRAAKILQSAGHTQVHDLGGMSRW
jgi:phage shock protein E